MHRHQMLFGLFVFLLSACDSEGAHTEVPGRSGGESSEGGKHSRMMARRGLSAKPKLIVQITIDQLRGDLPARYMDRFGEGGFKLLMENGVWYANASHPHARTETVVGHTTLATGAYPAAHGMVSNVWYDVAKKGPQKSISDSNYELLGEKKKKGVSPRGILASTFSDELSRATGGAAKIFAVSGKDRSSVPLAGHAGKAFFYASLSDQGSATGNFTTSSYYYDTMPTFVADWNSAEVDCGDGSTSRRVLCKLGKEWTLSNDLDTYIFKGVNNTFPAGSPPANLLEMLGLPDEANLYRSGFLHSFFDGEGGLRGHTFTADPKTPAYFNNLTISPELDRMTVDFAKMLVTTQELGKDEVPDYLAIGLSATDIIAHWWSPTSLESEENMLQLDATLADFFSWLDAEVGLDNTLIVLSGDHGGPEFPEVLAASAVGPALGQTYTGRVSPDTITSAVETALVKLAGGSISCIESGFGSGCLVYSFPYFYITDELVSATGKDRVVVEAVVAASVTAVDGIYRGVSVSEARTGDPVYMEMSERVRRNQCPGRSGQVFVIQEPQWQVNGPPSPGEGNSGMIMLDHGSPWAYDSFVPIVFAGAGLSSDYVTREVYTTDVAATLADLLGTNRPSAQVGQPLGEVSR